MDIYSSGSTIFINNSSLKTLEVEVFDIYGEKVLDTEIWDNGLQSLKVNQCSGNFLVRVNLDSQIYSQEIILK